MSPPWGAMVMVQQLGAERVRMVLSPSRRTGQCPAVFKGLRRCVDYLLLVLDCHADARTVCSSTRAGSLGYQGV